MVVKSVHSSQALFAVVAQKRQGERAPPFAEKDRDLVHSRGLERDQRTFVKEDCSQGRNGQ